MPKVEFPDGKKPISQLTAGVIFKLLTWIKKKSVLGIKDYICLLSHSENHI